jgi:membrane protein YdbS with pleckstrin-like domain
MTLFLILAPFAAFATLMMLTTVKISLVVAAVVALGIFGWDLVKGRPIKMLSAGAVILFAALCGYHLLAKELSPTSARLIVDSGVLAIALGSIAIRLPFTLQYARERVDAEIQRQPRFVRVNYILTWVWSAAFVLMLAVDVMMIYLPSIALPWPSLLATARPTSRNGTRSTFVLPSPGAQTKLRWRIDPESDPRLRQCTIFSACYPSGSFPQSSSLPSMLRPETYCSQQSPGSPQ